MRFVFLAALTVFGVEGCGGSVTEPIEGGAKDGPSDASVDTLLDAPGDSTPVDCNALGAKLTVLRDQILTCCPFCQTVQCNHVTQDLCCPISTTATNVTEFENLVAQYKAECDPTCPATPCPMVPSNVCMPGSTSNAPGTCK